MRHFLLLLILLYLCSFHVTAQLTKTPASTYRNSFFAELGGPGVLFSANIDHRFTPSRLGWGGRIGLGFFSPGEENVDPSTGYTSSPALSVLTIPVQVNYIFGKGMNPHTFEVGAGFTVLGRGADVFEPYLSNKRSSVLGTASFMYRRQPVDGGFTWRIGFTPIIANGYVQPSAAVGLGYNF